VLDLPDPNDPANTIDGIVGMHLFNDRDLVIDASPAASPEGIGPRVYIGDPVSQTHTWVSPVPQTSFDVSTNWSAPGVPNVMWDAELKNNLLPNQFVAVSQNLTVYRLSVGASAGRQMQLQLTGPTLTVYGEVRIEEGGQIFLGGKLDAQVVNIDAGRLFGSGEIFVGTGPFRGVVRNLGGSVDPGAIGAAGQLTIDGDYSQLDGGTLEIDLAGTTPVTQYDRLAVGRNAFLDGTLEVGLLGFTPSVGAEFTILTAGDGVFGQFDNLLLPAGFQWNVVYNPTNVVLSVIGLGGLVGDYNADGAVNAADYVLWHNSMGATGSSLPADGNGDQVVDHDDYLVWRSNFGKTAGASGSAAVTVAGVPEPTSFALGVLTIAVGFVVAPLSRKRLN
jgi:hypothetical protein